LAQLSHRIEVLHLPLQQLPGQVGCEGAFDAVVCNPPFFIDSLHTTDSQRNMARHADTLNYGELMDASSYLLNDKGVLSVIVPFDYCRRMEDEAIFHGFFLCRKCAVHTAAHKPAKRYLLAFRKQPLPCVQEQMTIGDQRYQALVRDFYL